MLDQFHEVPSPKAPSNLSHLPFRQQVARSELPCSEIFREKLGGSPKSVPVKLSIAVVIWNSSLIIKAYTQWFLSKFH